MYNDDNIKMGKDVFVGKNCLFDKIHKEDQRGVFSFGDYCSIHENCRFYFSNANFSIFSNNLTGRVGPK